MENAYTPGSASAFVSALLLLSLGVLLFSFSFYAYCYNTAATDMAYERRMWPFSKDAEQELPCAGLEKKLILLQGPRMDILEFEQRQYDSDVVPREYLGLRTEERRDAWDRLGKCESTRASNRIRHAANV